MTQALPDDRIAHLLFSTRQARPESSSGFNREVLAESPGMPEAGRRELEDLADMTGFVLRKPDLPPLWAFRRLGADLWLVVRAVSLGLYRKGNHQLLAHGLVLRRPHLEALEGNPFLLATAEAREAGFRFEERHPEGRRELEPLHLSPAFAEAAAHLNPQRFRQLSAELAGPDAPASPFPTLFDSLLQRDRTTAWIPPADPSGATHDEHPDPRFLEWVLLHLHPADRAELSFHGWYAYDSPRRFDLVGVARSDAEELRRHLRGEVEVWDPAVPAPPRPEGAAPSVGQRVQALRRRDPLHHVQALDTYYLTVLEPRFRPDLLERNLDVLTPEQAALCLRHELGEPLDDGELEELHKLYLRSGNDLLNNLARLAEAWERGPAPFAARLARHREVPLEAPRRDRELTLARVRSPAERWALLALLPLARPDAAQEELRRDWARLVADEGAFRELLESLRDPESVRLADEVLRPWMEALVASAEGGSPAPWSLYLRFLHHRDRPALPAAARFEALLEEVPEDARPAGYRELQRACFDAGLVPFALRLLFHRELPRLAAPPRRIRTADGVRRLLDTEGEADEVLGPALADPVVAEAAFLALGEWLAEHRHGSRRARGVEAAWTRCRRLLDHLHASVPGGLPPAAAGASALFLATLAEEGWDVADGLELLARGAGPEVRDRLLAGTARRLADRLRARGGAALPADAPVLRGTALLLDLRNDLPGVGEDADRGLLSLLRRTLPLAPPADGGALLRRPFVEWLEVLLAEDRLPALVDDPRAWRHLLLDEILQVTARPPAAPGPAGSGSRRPRAGGGFDDRLPLDDRLHGDGGRGRQERRGEEKREGEGPRSGRYGGEPPAVSSGDPRLRAYQRLAWLRWVEAATPEARSAAELGLLRATGGLSRAERLRALEATLPRDDDGAARSRLAALLPGTAGPRSGADPDIMERS